MAPSAADDPRRHPARTTALTGLIGDGGGGGRAFVDATGTAVALPSKVRRVVAVDDEVTALLLDLGAPVVGCPGSVEGIETVGPHRRPDPAAVAALRPDVIVVGARARVHDVEDPRLVGALRRVAVVLAVDLDRPGAARADLRALLGAVSVARPTPPRPKLDRSVGPPVTRPEVW